MSKLLSTEAREEWGAHWNLVVASTIGASMMGLGVTSFGAYIAPLEQEFGWKRAEISIALTIYAVAGVIFSPLFGVALDRWGPRRVGVPGILLACAAFALFATATSSILFWIVLWFIYSAVAQMPRSMIWSAAIASEFKAGRGLALSGVLAGGSFGALLSPILAGHLIDVLGWRLSYAVIGTGWGTVAGGVCYFFFRSRADRVGTLSTEEKKAAPVLDGVSAREGLLSATFAKLALSTLVSYVVFWGLIVHMIPLLSGTGLSRSDAIWLTGFTSFAAMFGVLLSGALVDRFPGHYVYAGFLSLILLAWPMLLMHTDSVLLRAIPLTLQGLTGGAQSHLLPYLTTRYFGLRAFGKILGVISSIIAIGLGIGPILAGYIYDRSHSYDLLLMAGIPAIAVAALLILSLGRYPDDPARVRPGAASA